LTKTHTHTTDELAMLTDENQIVQYCFSFFYSTYSLDIQLINKTQANNVEKHATRQLVELTTYA